MLLLQKHKIKGSYSRNYMSSLDDNLMTFGSHIIKSNYELFSLEKIFRPVQNTTDDNGFFGSRQGPWTFALNGANGSETWYSQRVPFEHSDCFMTDVPLKCTWTSTKGTTAGKKFAINAETNFHEVLPNGETKMIRVPGLRYWTPEYRTYFLYETVANFYLLSASSSHPNGETQSSIIRVIKSDYSFSIITSIGTDTTSRAKLIRQDESRFMFQVFCPSYGDSDYLYFYYIDLETEVASGISSPTMSRTNTPGYGGINMVPGNLTTDQSNPSKRKFYKVGGLTSNFATPLNIYRFQTKDVMDFYEGTNTYAACTLNNMGSNTLVVPIATNNVASPWHDGAEINTFVITANSGNEYLFYLCKMWVNAVPTSTQMLPEKHYWHLFSIDPTDSKILTRKQSEVRSGYGFARRFFGYLKSWDFKTFVIFAADGFFVLRWNEVTEQFEQSQFYNILYKNISLNEKNEILVMAQTNILYVFQTSLTTTISVTFSDPDTSLDYYGAPIQTDLKVNAYDMVGNRMVQEVILTATNAVFTDNSSSTLTVNTSDSADTVVSLTINSAGVVTVTPSL